jgi:hypothetical protein
MYLQEIEIIIEKYDCIEWNNSRGSQKTTSTFCKTQQHISGHKQSNIKTR